MGYSIFFHFVKDSEIDANDAFVQNIYNFLLDLSNGYIKRYYEEDQDERDELLTNLFKEIKYVIDGYFPMKLNFFTLNDPKDYNDNNKEINNLINEYIEESNIKSIEYYTFDEMKTKLKNQAFKKDERLMEICTENVNEVKMEINLRLYCIFVNSLSKTTGKKLKKLKKEWKNG